MMKKKKNPFDVVNNPEAVYVFGHKSIQVLIAVV